MGPNPPTPLVTRHNGFEVVTRSANLVLITHQGLNL